MAIAYDAHSGLGEAGPGTSLSGAHVCTGSNRLLIASILSQSGDIITGVTYNSVAMTQVGKVNTSGGSGGEWVYQYYLINPASGSNTLTATASGSSFFQVCGDSYTGVIQTSPLDVSTTGTDASAGTMDMTLTTTVDNDWMVASTRNGTTASSNATLRGNAFGTVSAAGIGAWDTNAAQTPAGSKTMTVNNTANAGFVVAAFKPAAAAVVNMPELRLAFI